MGLLPKISKIGKQKLFNFFQSSQFLQLINKFYISGRIITILLLKGHVDTKFM